MEGICFCTSATKNIDDQIVETELNYDADRIYFYQIRQYFLIQDHLAKANARKYLHSTYYETYYTKRVGIDIEDNTDCACLPKAEQSGAGFENGAIQSR